MQNDCKKRQAYDFNPIYPHWSSWLELQSMLIKTLPSFQSLTQYLAQWRQKQQRFFSARAATAPSSKKVQLINYRYNSSANGNVKPPFWGKVCVENWLRTSNRSLIVFALAVVSLTGIMGQHFYNQPKLDVNTIAPQTIVAHANAYVEDTKTTEANRKAARIGSVPVLMIDSEVNQKIEQDIQQALLQGNELRQMVGHFPFVQTSTLSFATQHYLRECSEAEWLSVLAALESNNEAQKQAFSSLMTGSSAQAVAELQAYQSRNSSQKLSELITTITQFRHQYAQTWIKIPQITNSVAEPLNYSVLLALSDQDWEKTQTGIHDSAERILTQGIPDGLPASILQQAVHLQVQTLVPPDAENLANQMLMHSLKPNLKQDIQQTRLQAEQAASQVPPVMVEAHKGQPIVLAGQTITQQDFVLLDYFHLSRREINWLGLVQLSGLVIAAIGVFEFVEWQFQVGLRQRDRLLVLLLTLSTPVLVTLGISYISLPTIGLLLGSFYGSPLGVTVVVLITVLLPGSLTIPSQHLIASAAGGILGSWVAGRLRSREELALLGGAIGITQGFFYFLVNLLLGNTGSLWYVGVGEAALCGAAGLAWSIVALGLSPYLEHLFDLVTPSRLAELANPNRPLLQRLATKAPGTFQHTLFVSTLAEAAAKVLQCNVELVRAGTLYHDIGKLHDPLAFIENQMGGVNKHDEINNPWQSALIIKKHVSEGLVMARKYRLPTAIQAFIPEHQGTMLIAYFYHQAQQQAQQNPDIVVEESDFRYNGPIPRSRETGIVMLADSCEAALRSLKEATLEEALAMVNKILRARWQDNQMVNSGLKREEMSQLAEIFVDVWLQFNHKRIAYPKIARS